MIIGIINAISTSKIKKIIAIKKNRIEKGYRDEFKGLKPHSKGVSLFRSINIFLDKIDAKSITIEEIINNRKAKEKIRKIKKFFCKSVCYKITF
jgi:hypothetical protein